MNAKQTLAFLGRIVEHGEEFRSLSTSDAQWAIQNPKGAAKLCVAAIKGHENGTPKVAPQERTYKLLQLLTPPANNEPITFKADDTFFAKKTNVKVSYCGDNFVSWFTGKVEENVEPAQLTPFKLTQNARDSDIIRELGGSENAAEVNLVDVWRLMERQPNGESGVLLTDGGVNIFYVRDKNNVLSSVYVVWRGDGWSVFAVALGDWWNAGGVVFSRAS